MFGGLTITCVNWRLCVALLPWLTPVWYAFSTKIWKKKGCYGDILSSSIDGHAFSVTENDIAHTLGCHPNVSGFSHFPATPIVASITNEICGGRFSKENYTITRRSYLPQRMCLIDQVLHANAFPTHHKDERRGDFLDTLYAIHSG